ncbi:unnamed protein product [Owenia fusiformis]|uniref:G-protein coupled receptors family 1 profile domain-containing protein n=1 Tax=Owenia fusiformis TaxID=6347 RepID=A0A8S4PVJ5_OWEFU|nr:unnamed protein product [Owenia fusiformis]
MENFTLYLTDVSQNNETTSLTEHIGYAYVIPIICGIGMLLNALNLIVFTRKLLKGSTFTYLTANSAVDLLTLSLVFPIGLVRCGGCATDSDSLAAFGKVYEYYIYLPIANMSACASVWITLAVSVERYIYVGYIRSAKTLCTVKNARFGIIAIVLGAICLNTPYFFPYRVDTSDNTVELTEFGQSQNYQAYSWIRISLAKFLPLGAMILTNCLLIYELHQATKRRRAMSTTAAKRQKLQAKITTMLVCMCVLFVICHVPEALSHVGLFRSIFTLDEESLGHKTLRLTSNILEMLSYTLNFVLYYFFNSQFRYVLCGLCRCMREAKIEDTAGETTNSNMQTNHNGTTGCNHMHHGKPPKSGSSKACNL